MTKDEENRIERALMWGRRDGMRSVLSYLNRLLDALEPAGMDTRVVKKIHEWVEQRELVLNKAVQQAQRNGTGFPETLDDDLSAPEKPAHTPPSEDPST